MIKYPLASTTWDEKELRAVQKVIESGNYTMGKQVIKYEKMFAEFVGSNHCVMVNSGSSANLLAVASLFYVKVPKLKRRDEVIVPAVSWATTYSPLYQYGLKLKFADIDLNTLNYNLDELKKAVSSKTKMILVVNLLGNPNDFDIINNIIGDRDIILVEDNCEALGATYRGKHTGTFGLLGTYSSFFSHHISTIEGGMIVTDNEELYHILLSLRAHGWTRQLPKENLITKKSNDIFEESYRFILPGYNVRPTEISGAIGIEQLKKLPDLLDGRRKNAKYFLKLFKEHPIFIIQKDVDNSSWFGFSLVIKSDTKIKRSDIIKCLTKNGIECRPIVAGNILRNNVIKYFNYEVSGNMKNANYLHENGLFIGNHHYDISHEIDRLKITCTKM